MLNASSISTCCGTPIPDGRSAHRNLSKGWNATPAAPSLLGKAVGRAELPATHGNQPSILSGNVPSVPGFPLMSGLFVQMVVARRGLRGQTLTIAVAKWLGTLAPTILFGVIEGSRFLLGLGILCCVFDLVYLGLVVWSQ
jgi:hypothetical protein